MAENISVVVGQRGYRRGLKCKSRRLRRSPAVVLMSAALSLHSTHTISSNTRQYELEFAWNKNVSRASTHTTMKRTQKRYGPAIADRRRSLRTCTSEKNVFLVNPLERL